MWDYVDVILKIFYEDTFLRTFVCEFLRTIVFDILGTAPELVRVGGGSGGDDYQYKQKPF